MAESVSNHAASARPEGVAGASAGPSSSSAGSNGNGEAAEPKGRPKTGDTGAWGVKDSTALYQVRDWGNPYFSVNAKGHVVVTPNPDSENTVNLYELTLDLRARGIELPILVRFSDILAHRIKRIHEAFERAIAEY